MNARDEQDSARRSEERVALLRLIDEQCGPGAYEYDLDGIAAMEDWPMPDGYTEGED